MDSCEKIALKKKYISKYKHIYADIAKGNKKVEELIIRLADLSVILDECKEHLMEEGPVSLMQQGDYVIERENPWSKVADTKHKTYLSVMSKLDDMMPTVKEAVANKAGDDLKDFIAKGKKIELR